jgi:hypothetical protein
MRHVTALDIDSFMEGTASAVPRTRTFGALHYTLRVNGLCDLAKCSDESFVTKVPPRVPVSSLHWLDRCFVALLRG